VLRPSDTITVLSPMRMLPCMILSAAPGMDIEESGLSFQRISIATSASSVFL
jgi:hypothetical protein